MTQFAAINRAAEVNGETVLSIVNGMEMFRDEAYRILKEHHIDTPRPGQWYLQQDWLDSFREIAEKLGASTLFLIGKKIPDSARWPAQIDAIDKALASIDVAYHMNHRIDGIPLFDPAAGAMREGIGHYGFEKTGERSIRMVCDNPYPCDFDRGIIDAVARKFKPAGFITLSIRHDDTRPCRKKGHDSCTYHVTW